MKRLATLIKDETPKSRIDFLQFQKELNRPLILDGAIGTLLQEQQIPNDANLWSSISNINSPDEIIRIHEEYISAGAEIITTNTFRTNPTAYKNSKLNLSNEDFVRKSVGLAKQSAGDKKIIVAGSNATAEDCYQKERTLSKNEIEYNHKKHIEWLWKSGCDIILNETQSHLDEIEIIAKFCSENSLPFIVSLYFDDTLKLLSGEELKTALELVESYSPLAVGFNCIKPELFLRFVKTGKLPQQFGVYFNCGAGHVNDATIKCAINPSEYLNFVKSVVKLKPVFIGSCCGSNPNHTRAIKEYFDEIYGN